MKKKSLIILVFLILQCAYCQTTVRMTSTFGVKEKELRDVLFFENLDIETITFDSKAINGKDYEINLTEYKNGNASNSVKLFDTTGYFTIDSTFAAIKFFSKVAKDEVELMIIGKGYRSQKQTFRLLNSELKYVLKDFQGAKNFVDVPLEKEFPILALLTPTMHKDGSGSYCEVANSGVAASDLGKKFNIPHYFIISMKFK